MHLFYYKGSPGNFGDELNSWLWHRVSPGLVDTDESRLLVGIGTLLAADVPLRFPRARQIFVLGSGAGYAALPDVARAPWADLTVRGPLTARALHLPEADVGTDSAILLAGQRDFAPVREDLRSGVVFMPHHQAPDRFKWRDVCLRAGVTYLDPTWDSQALVEKIRWSKLVLADAMHAAIVADAMRVPWVPLTTSAGISTTKWLDWTASLGIEYQAHFAPPVSVEARARARGMRLYGQSLRVEPATLDNPVHLNRLTTLKQSRRSHLKMITTKAAVRGASRMYESFGRPHFDHEAPVDFIRDLSRVNPSLSGDGMFHDRLRFMQERLRAIESTTDQTVS